MPDPGKAAPSYHMLSDAERQCVMISSLPRLAGINACNITGSILLHQEVLITGWFSKLPVASDMLVLHGRQIS